MEDKPISLIQLRQALEASWESRNEPSLGVLTSGKNDALGQCYATSQVIQHYFPKTQIVVGQVWTGESMKKHFWNVIENSGIMYDIDLTWQQFPQGSKVVSQKMQNSDSPADSKTTVNRYDKLSKRVNKYLKNN